MYVYSQSRFSRFVARVLCTTILSLTMTGCRQIAPPSADVNPPPTPAQHVSDLSTSVNVNLASIASLAFKKLPKPLDSGTDPQHITINMLVKAPGDLEAAGIKLTSQKVLGWVEHISEKICDSFIKYTGICLISHLVDHVVNHYQDVLVPENWLFDKIVDGLPQVHSPVDVSLEHNVQAERLQLTMTGNTLTVAGDVSIAAKLDLDAWMASRTIGVIQCGFNEPRPVIHFVEPITITWKDANTLSLQKQPWSFSWSTPCNLTAANISAETVLHATGLESKLDKVVDQELAKIPETIDLQARFAGLWGALSPPLQVAPSTWLSVNPQRISISNPIGTSDGSTLQLNAGISALPEITYGAPPSPGGAPMPVVDHPPAIANRPYFLEIEASLPYKTAEDQANAQLAGKVIAVGGHQFHLYDFQIYGSGSNIVIGVSARPVDYDSLALLSPGRFRGRIWLYGTPRFDTNSMTFVVDHLDYTVETRNVLVEAADWLLHSSFADYIASKATFTLDDRQKATVAALLNYTRPVGQVGSLHVKTSIVGASVYETKQGVRARIDLRGTAVVSGP